MGSTGGNRSTALVSLSNGRVGSTKSENESTTCWLWSLIIFLIQRSLLSAVFIPHEVFTPQKYVHSSMRGSTEGGYPLCGVWGGYPPRLGCLGASRPPAGVRGKIPPKEKFPCKSIL
jgi:hypothetical protein